MNDRELLELAAKAAGIRVRNLAGATVYRLADNQHDNDLPVLEWNPLTDDGDALRLVVKLRLSIEHSDYVVYVGTSGDEGDDLAAESVTPSITRDAATRRAIVRAAAEIGRSMP